MTIFTGVKSYDSRDFLGPGFQLAAPAPEPGIYDNRVIDEKIDPVHGDRTYVQMQLNERSLTGSLSGGYFYDWYFRIHVLPGKINLGNILSTEVREFIVWNAYLTPKQMTSYTEPSGEGIDITEPVVAPYTIGALEELTYDVTVSPSGPSDFDLDIEFNIDSVIYTVNITGKRVVVFPFQPNWVQPVSEEYEYYTSIFTSYDSTEERESFRSKPRQSISYYSSLAGNDVNLLNNLLYGWQDRQYAIPLWNRKSNLKSPISSGDQVISINTVDLNFVEGGLAVIYTDTYNYETFNVLTVEDNQITAVKQLNSDWPITAKCYPMTLGILPKTMQLSRLTSKVATMNFEWTMIPYDNDPGIDTVSAPDTYNGKEIFFWKPNWVQPVNNSFAADYELVDNNIGNFIQSQGGGFNRLSLTARWMLKDKSEIHKFKQFHKRMMGSAGDFYLPTWCHDFEMVEEFSAGANIIKVRNTEFNLLVGADSNRGHILIRLRDGTNLVRSITGVNKISDTVEQLTIGTVISQQIKISDVLMISLVHLMRFAGDALTINYLTDGVATVQQQFTAVKE